MKKYFLSIIIIFLISFTTLIKNTSKNLENEIYNKKENLILLNTKYDLVLLENNYLTSPKKLFDYIKDSKDNEYKPIDIIKINKIYFYDNKIIIKKVINE